MGHHHTHSDSQSAMPFHDKARKLIDHWKKHNADHAAEYRRWASTFRQHHMEAAANALEAAAASNERINSDLDRAKATIQNEE